MGIVKSYIVKAWVLKSGKVWRSTNKFWKDILPGDKLVLYEDNGAMTVNAYRNKTLLWNLCMKTERSLKQNLSHFILE